MATKQRWLTAEQQRAWQFYRLATRQLEAHLARDLARNGGLSMQDYDVLSALTDSTDHRRCAKDLATHLLWSASRLSHHLDRMQRRNLIHREGCPAGPGTDIVLTPAGRAAIEAAAPSHVAAVRDAFIDRISSEDLATLTRISGSILDAVDNAPR
jgi:DNA-binding MarR family transcriptional regulator